MRLKLAIKTMLRSPLKTLLTFALLIAASFMLVYSAADYALTAREYRRAYGRYRGIGSVEYGPGESIFGPFYPYFLLTDPRSPVSPERIKDYDKPINEKWLEEKYHYERFHQKSISASVMDEMASLPYVTSMGRRYMTAGVSEDYYRMENYEEHFNYPGRFVFEATLNELYKSSPDASSGGWPNQPVRVLLLEDIEMLAGNTEWLEIPELPKYGDMRRVAIGTFDLPIPEYLDSAYYCTDISRVVVVSRFNRCYMEQLESMVPGNRYVFVGRVEPYSWIGFEHFCMGDDMLYNWWPYIYPIPLDTGIAELPENYLELDECAPLRELIQITNDDLHTFDVVYTDDMGAIRRVTEEKILVTEGRLLTPEDSQSGNRVCVVSDAFLKANNLSLGDRLSLRLGNELFEQYAPLGAVASARERYADTFVEEEFEIVGAYVDINAWKMRDADLYWAYSDSTVFVPLSFLPLSESELEGHEFKPGEVSFVVGEAKNIRAFTEECIPKLEEMGLTVFFTDGGWLGIEEKFIRTKALSLSKLLAFTAALIPAVTLTVFLFIGRKKREYAVMRALGTPKRKANRTLLVPLLALAVIAVALGSVGAMVYAARTAGDSMKTFEALGLEMDTTVPVPVAFAGGFGVLALLALFSVSVLRGIGRKPPLMLLYDNAIRQRGRMKRGKAFRPEPDAAEAAGFSPAPDPAAISQLSDFTINLPEKRQGAARHVLRYIARHGRRAIIRSLLTLALAALLIGAMGQFAAVRRSYGELYRGITVKARFIRGMPYSTALKVADSGYAESPYYEYIHKNSEADYISAEVYMTSDIRRVIGAEIEFLEGYDEKTVMTLEEKICVLPGGFMESLGLVLGDEVMLNNGDCLNSLLINNSEEEARRLYEKSAVYCKVVGRDMTQSEAQTVYVRVAAEEFLWPVIGHILYLDLAEYKLSDYHMADEFRSYAKGTIDKIRDAAPMFLMDTSDADNIYKVYRLLGTLYPIAMAVAILLGGALPGLIIIQTAKEASIMRVLGTTKKRTRLMLILEQLILCLFGMIFALVLLAAVNGTAILSVAKPLGLYCALHIVGCAAGVVICAIVITRRRILELLQVKE